MDMADCVFECKNMECDFIILTPSRYQQHHVITPQRYQQDHVIFFFQLLELSTSLLLYGPTYEHANRYHSFNQ